MNPEVDPAHIIRAYVWAVLQANDPTIWDKNKYGGKIPITPLSEEAELTEFAGPYIVYTFSQTPSEIPCNDGTMTLAIYDTDIRRLFKTTNILSTALNREDETATDINKFSSGDPQSTGAKPFVGIRFGYVKRVYSEGPEPPETEGGRGFALISLEYEYFVDYDVVTDVGYFAL